MSQAYKCDICGKFYEGMSPSCCTDHVDRYDVCLDCLESFHLWKESRNPDHKSAFEDKEDQ